ncbi:TPA: hypothetical protein ND026_001634 [Citrobacter werkmanii]|nr:hypothetical protein [Citrobacter werkmanii]
MATTAGTGERHPQPPQLHHNAFNTRARIITYNVCFFDSSDVDENSQPILAG